MRLTFTVQLSSEQVEEIIEGRQRGIGNIAISIKSNRVLAPPRRDETILPRWLNVREASRYCGLSTATLGRLVKQKHIVSHMRGRRLIDRISLDEWVERDSDAPKKGKARELPRLNEVDVESIASEVVRMLRAEQ